MRLTSKCTIVLSMFGICCAALPQVPQQPTISIESKSPTVESGQPIQIHVVLKNSTDRVFSVFKSVGGGRGEQYYSISVTGPDGNPAAPTEYGVEIQKHPRPVAGSKIRKTVAPGEEVDEYVTLSRLFNMVASGTYVVQVSRDSPVDPAITIKSNTLTIEVNQSTP